MRYDLERKAHHLDTSEKFFIGCLASSAGALTMLYWLVGAITQKDPLESVFFLALLTIGLIWSAFITGRSWQILRKDEQAMALRDRKLQ
jgi:hypothetical protein